MTQEDMQKLTEILNLSASVFQHSKLEPYVIREYFKALKDYSLSEIESALNTLSTDSEWFPKPFHIREEIRRVRSNTKLNRQFCDLCEGLGYLFEYRQYTKMDVYDVITREHFDSLRGSEELKKKPIYEYALRCPQCNDRPLTVMK